MKVRDEVKKSLSYRLHEFIHSHEKIDLAIHSFCYSIVAAGFHEAYLILAAFSFLMLILAIKGLL
jgi:hypothetical protein